jgi:hypothetical protein
MKVSLFVGRVAQGWVGCSSMFQVESRLYSESMAAATAKSKPASSKLDEKELSRLQKQDYWLQVTRAKLVMDLIFVCTFPGLERCLTFGPRPRADFFYPFFPFARSLRCV